MNPNQKSGNFKKRPQKKLVKKPIDRKMQKIARQEVHKTLAKKSESKYFDVVQTATRVGWNGGPINSLTNGMINGSGTTNRIGREILPTHVRIRGSFLAGAQTSVIRLILIQTVQDNISISTYAEFLEQQSNLQAPFSPYKAEHVGEYKVLFDEFYCSVIGTESSRLTFDIRIPSDKLKKKMSFEDSGLPSVGGLYLYMISDRDPSTATNAPEMNYVSRLYFKDF